VMEEGESLFPQAKKNVAVARMNTIRVNFFMSVIMGED
jgi:hypothetical protein